MIDYPNELRQKLLNIDNTRDNVYQLDAYPVPDDGKKHPWALILPGGGYEFVSNSNEGYPFALECNQRGISAFVVFYPIKEKALYPAPHEAVARALREIFERAEEYHLDTTRYSIWGSSAGGHLCGSYVTNFDDFTPELAHPSAAVMVYPVVTMDDFTHEGTRHNIIGDNPDPALKKKMSIEKNITPDTPPMYIWCGDCDGCVPPKNSEVLAAALAENGVKHKFHLYHNEGHGCGLGVGGPAEGWIDEAIDFLIEVHGE